MARPLFWLKVSRPGLWFQTLWLYLLPTSHQPVFQSSVFWLGLFYVTFPLKFLVYGWNDIVDFETDRHNPRKDSFLFGARGSREDLAALPMAMTLVQLPFLLAFIGLRGWMMALLIAGMLLVNGLYNLPSRGWRGRPPLELVNQAGYLLLLPLSILLNQVPQVSWAAIGYLVLFCTHSHLMGEIMDIVPDAQANRLTSARVLGIKATKSLVLVLVLLEGLLLGCIFHDWVLGSFLLLGVVWLLADLLLIFRDHPYTPGQFRLFGLAINLSGFASMAWVWENGTLTR